IHSGAGRIVSLRMRPLSFAERGVCEPTVSLRAVLAGEQPPIVGHSSIGLPGYVDEILRSGFPGIREIAPRARDLQLDSYLSRVVEHELAENGMSVRRPTALRAWLAGYAAATSTDASYTAILDAATAGASDKPVRQTADTYREHLERLFLLDPLPAWIPSFSPLRRLTHTPKHHLVDPALAARLVGVQAEGLLRGEGVRVRTRGDTGTWLGALFESLVVQSVRTYADAVQATVGHLRTKSTEREIDLIVERADRSIVAIEIKLSATVDDKDVRHLTWIREQLPDRVVDTVVINTGEHAYRRSDGVAVIPLALLGP
ncbi:MAG: ATP-binding protein, partial [Candidatus Nanopelagicales bacterium]